MLLGTRTRGETDDRPGRARLFPAVLLTQLGTCDEPVVCGVAWCVIAIRFTASLYVSILPAIKSLPRVCCNVILLFFVYK